jgi:hypothetical protein
MFNLWGKRRKRRSATAHCQTVRRGGARRLGVEPMEGRLMLSTSAADFTSSEFLSIRTFLEGHLPKAPVIEIGTLVEVVNFEGGFITPDSVMLDSFNISAGRNWLTYRNNLTPSTVITSSDSVDFGNVYLDTTAIRGLVIPAADSDGGMTTTIEQSFTGSLAAGTNRNEGGAIPIEPILAIAGHGPGLEPGQHVVQKATARAGESKWLLRTVIDVTEGDKISGEWARPTMLEMAGGEPARPGPPAAPQREVTPTLDADDIPRAAQPLSSRAVPGTSALNVAQHRASNPTRSTGATIPTENIAAANQLLSPNSEWSAWLASVSTPAHANSRILSDASNLTEVLFPANSTGTMSGLDTSAYAEVYEQLGRSDQTVAQSLAGDAWRHAWKATPLLMILALERIAASNSRREKPESSARPRRPSRRSVESADGAEAV